MKKDFVLPILVLTLICMLISSALAVTNSFTAPVITSAAAARAESARNSIIPEADGFELMQLDGLPATVTEVYKSTNNVGYIFMLKTPGYGGDINLICGIKEDGTIIACKTLSQTETKGLGTKVTETPFESQFVGKDASLDEVSVISGATISSKAYINAIEDAFAAVEIAKEVQ